MPSNQAQQSFISGQRRLGRQTRLTIFQGFPVFMTKWSTFPTSSIATIGFESNCFCKNCVKHVAIKLTHQNLLSGLGECPDLWTQCSTTDAQQQQGGFFFYFSLLLQCLQWSQWIDSEHQRNRILICFMKIWNLGLGEFKLAFNIFRSKDRVDFFLRSGLSGN